MRGGVNAVAARLAKGVTIRRLRVVVTPRRRPPPPHRPVVVVPVGPDARHGVRGALVPPVLLPVHAVVARHALVRVVVLRARDWRGTGRVSTRVSLG